MNQNYEALLLTAIHAALQGGKQILDVYTNEDTVVEIKSDNSPLTQADNKSNAAIMAVLNTTGIPVLSEEGKQIPFEERDAWEQLWIVDPLDGTKEFIKRNGEFTVNIALIQHGMPELGVIYVPVTGDLYFAAKGVGSFKIAANADATFNDLHLLIEKSEKLPIASKRKFTVVGSRSHMTAETSAFIASQEAEHGQIEILSRGSSLKICMIAEGLADVYPRFAPTMEWDTAAGHAIAKFAGFQMFLHNQNQPLVYNKPDLLNPWFIVRKTN
jgi:3'(2'), 5'-bisphosphate nucleotidase